MTHEEAYPRLEELVGVRAADVDESALRRHVSSCARCATYPIIPECSEGRSYLTNWITCFQPPLLVTPGCHYFRGLIWP